MFSKIQSTEQYVKECFKFRTPLVWRNIIGLSIITILSVYTAIFVIPQKPLLQFVLAYAYGFSCGVGVTCGAHRLWTHRSYKAKLPVRILLMLLFSGSGQYSLVRWARDHRLHHKYTDTDSDPHNAKRGFFFSHCGWLMMKRLPEVREKIKLIDVSDLLEDSVVRFHQKYFVSLFILMHIVIPFSIPYFLFNETLDTCILEWIVFRYFLQLNFTWIVNSLAHIYGNKPYDHTIMATQNTFTSIFAMGEGWHNFHHVFPWDYRIGEYNTGLQTGAMTIEFFAWLGLAYDLKTASEEMIWKLKKKTYAAQIREVPHPNDKINQNNLIKLNDEKSR